MDSGSPASYAVVALHYHDPGALTECLAAVKMQTVSPIEVTVVDNGSDADDLAQALTDADVRLVREPKNLGYGAAMEHGRAQSQPAAATLFLTQDCVLAPAAAAALIEAMAANPDIGILGPLLRRRSDETQVWSGGGRLRGPSMWPSHDSDRPATVTDVTWLDGAALFVRSEVLQNLQLDGGYFLYFEDVEFCVRAKALGWRVAIVPDAVACQEPGDLNVYLATRNHIRFVRRNGNAVNLLATLARHAVYLCADAVRAVSPYRRRRLRQRLRGLLDAFSGNLRVDTTARA